MNPDINAIIDHYSKTLSATEAKLALAVGHNVALSKELDAARQRIADLTPSDPPPPGEEADGKVERLTTKGKAA
jgi:hypothetical protein